VEKRLRFLIFITAGIVIVFLSAACTTGKVTGSGSASLSADKTQAQIKPLVEALYLKIKDLEVIYLDLRTVANAHAFLPDDLQLSYIQKTALYVRIALQSASSQWEILSIMQDIKPAALQDYYTLRHRALSRALDETGYDLIFLKLYKAYISSAEAQKDILSALTVIEEIRNIYGQLIDAIAPLVRQGLPTSI
jgi:hypothetical protein